jgi:1,4-alpha-glucan branching enzyme
MSRDRGALALVLHSHMPYVEGFGTWPFGEEWLWEAVATVYLPLLDVLADAPVTLGLTPVLCDQLETLPGPAGDRLARFLSDVRAEIHAEDARGLEAGGERELAAEVRRAAGDYRAAEAALVNGGRDLIGALRALADDGPAELWTSAATHAVLPLLATDAGVRLQLATGIASHERRFGAFEGGLWLPECAYAPGIERELAGHGVAAFCVDQTAANGLDAPEQLEPVATAAGPVAVPIDWRTVELVWSGEHGYPVDPAYRDYHRRTVHDLKPWNNGGGAYDHDAALGLAREHARDFVACAIARLDGYAEARGRPGLLTCAVDTELLGHWWYEGPTWLAEVLAEAPRQGLDLVTVSGGLERVEPVERELAPSTWGTGKDLSTWDSGVVAELAFSARAAELRTVHVAALRHEPPAALARATRELLALQSSDWAFLWTRALAADYPLERVRAHAAAHDDALRALTDSPGMPGAPDPRLRNLAPDLSLASLVAP